MKKHSIDNIDLIFCLLDLVDTKHPSENAEIPANSTRPMLKNSGKKYNRVKIIYMLCRSFY